MSDLGTPALLAMFVGAALATWVAGVNLAKATCSMTATAWAMRWAA